MNAFVKNVLNNQAICIDMREVIFPNHFNATLAKNFLKHQLDWNIMNRVIILKNHFSVWFVKKIFIHYISWKNTGKFIQEKTHWNAKLVRRVLSNQAICIDRHEKSHISKPFQCITCKKLFKESVALESHERIHKLENPHQCTICKRYFNNSHHLVRHERTHTGEKPFECNTCKKCFMQSFSLIRHVERFHKKNKQCTKCEKKFDSRKELKTHERIHAAENPWMRNL